jgi:hypothetical protein
VHLSRHCEERSDEANPVAAAEVLWIASLARNDRAYREKHMPRAKHNASTTGRRGEDAADAAHANRILAELAKGSETLLTSEQVDALLAAKTKRGSAKRNPKSRSASARG